MKINTARARVCALLLAAVAMTAAYHSAFAQQAPVAYHSNFGLPTESIDASGRTVIVLQGTGDLPGVLTLVLTLAPDGTMKAGEWALNVSYTAPLHPDAQPDPQSADPDSGPGEQLIQKGTLSGSIRGGSVTVTNGQVSAVSSLQLVITGGTLQFAGLTQGNGTVDAMHVDDPTNSTGYLSLTF